MFKINLNSVFLPVFSIQIQKVQMTSGGFNLEPLSVYTSNLQCLFLQHRRFCWFLRAVLISQKLTGLTLW